MCLQTLDSLSFKEALGKFIITENLSLSFIESKAFVDLLKLPIINRYDNLDSKLCHVKSDTKTEYVMTKFLSEKGKIADTFKTVESKVSLTTDAWTSPNAQGILGVTGLGLTKIMC